MNRYAFNSTHTKPTHKKASCVGCGLIVMVPFDFDTKGLVCSMNCHHTKIAKSIYTQPDIPMSEEFIRQLIQEQTGIWHPGPVLE